jgi:transposase
VSQPTVSKAVKELGEPGSAPLPGRARRAGGGRKPLTETDPQVVAALEALVDPATRGDPESPLRWTSKWTRELAEALGAQGPVISHVSVGALLRAWGYSLQAAAKNREGKQHANRDAQFPYLTERVNAYLTAGDPEQVDVRDFPDPDVGKAVPYGVYDGAANTGWANVGRDHDTAEFAVTTLRALWHRVGRPTYPEASRLLICADSGGSNGARTRLWKVELAGLAAETGLAITCCHLPPGTSKWNQIEHRLFSRISMNWRGRPLESHEAVVQLIFAITTRTALRMHAELGEGTYPKGIKITDKQMNACRWNDTISGVIRNFRACVLG